MNATVSLHTHCGSQRVDRKTLDMVKTPDRTNTWHPLPHGEVLDGIKGAIADLGGMTVEKEDLALAHEGLRFFATLTMRHAVAAEYALAIGIRNSHDKSYPAGLCVGSRVFVCDNLAFSGEITIARKHTVNIRRDLPRLIAEAVGRIPSMRLQQDKRIETYQLRALTNETFHDLCIRSIDSGVLAASKLPALLDEYRRPQHTEFAERNVWSAFNAFTEILKGYDVQDLPRRTQRLHGLCDVICGLN